MSLAGSGATPSKRACNACQRCRQRKVKCSGSRPCVNCLRRRSECVFDSNGRKLLISERYLRNLQRSAHGMDYPVGLDDQSGPNHLPDAEVALTTSHDVIIESDFVQPRPQETTEIAAEATMSQINDVAESEDEDDLQNPLVATTASYVVDNTGRSRALGESSTWSLSRRTFALAERMFPNRQASMALNEQGTAYELNWTCQSADCLSIDDLPSFEYAFHLTNIVRFHVGLYFHLFDDALFAAQLDRFYAQEDTTVTDMNRLWFVQFYLVMAFGKALTVRGKQDRSPPGSEYFTHAMALLPDLAHLYKDALISIEIFCAISLYLQSADHRNAAYLYIGQALRMALTYGLHRERPTGVHHEQSERCRSVWWTVYTLDRSFSSSMGVPTSLQDRDISAALPDHQLGTTKGKVLSFYTRISRNLAQVIDTVYGPDGRLHRRFLPSIQKVLETAANLGRELETTFPLVPKRTSKGISRIAASLNIFYHHVILLATYPLLFCLLEKKMQDIQRSSPHQRSLSSRTQALLQNSIDSASKMTRILSVLRNEHLLEYFLPFDLEHAFSAAFVLTISSVISPESQNAQGCRHEIHLVLEDMASQGNRPSGFRMSELIALEGLQEFLQNAGCNFPSTSAPMADNHEISDRDDLHDSNANIYDNSINLDTLDGLSPDHILSIAQLLPYSHESVASNDSWFEGWIWDQ